VSNRSVSGRHAQEALQRCASEFGNPSLHAGVNKGDVKLPIERLDYRPWRTSRRRHANGVEKARLEIRVGPLVTLAQILWKPSFASSCGPTHSAASIAPLSSAE
jgi:hypothetical protein